MVAELKQSGVLPSQINLLMAITNSRNEIDELIKDDWFGEMQKRSLNGSVI